MDKGKHIVYYSVINATKHIIPPYSVNYVKLLLHLLSASQCLKKKKLNRQKLLLILIKRFHLKYRSRSPLPVFALSYARL